MKTSTNMKRTVYIGLAIAGLMPFVTYAQDQNDALRYSQLILGGTARFTAMGGAFTALGNDPSVLAYNPAGLGVFTKSQLTFTPGFTVFSNSTTYNGSSGNSSEPVLTIQNAAWISSWRNQNNDDPWKRINFGIAYTRNNNFNVNTDIVGNSTNSTMLDQFTAGAQGYFPNQLDQYSAYQAYMAGRLIYNNTSDSTKYSNIIRPYLNGTNSVTQQKSMQTRGSMGETDFSFAADYNNKLYLGATLGIPNVNYTENAYYAETPNYKDTVWGLQGWDYTTTLQTRGVGINFKIGAIFRATDWLRIGAAIHTPTWFNLTDNYSSLVTASYADTKYYTGGSFTGTSDGSPYSGSYNYSIVTPFRAMGGLAFVIHKQGIISADYEYVPYQTAQLSSADAGTFNVANAAIQQYYAPASNLRVGAEWVLYPFSLRVGYQMYGNPYNSNSGNSSVRNVFSAGLGIAIHRCFVDMAYVLTNYNVNYYLYDPSLVSPVQMQNSVSDFVMTFGVNF